MQIGFGMIIFKFSLQDDLEFKGQKVFQGKEFCIIA